MLNLKTFFFILTHLLYLFIAGVTGPPAVNYFLKGLDAQIEKALVNDGLRISKVSWQFRTATGTATVYNFAVIHPWNLLFS